ncbi:autotransporter assembly complex family protein [Simiduia curdlanivorans]|uniref:Translocation and assembly module subunit TamA n=1 Tax=Simiduia curdlanivorans TaxID=1492769 RepID=A0ABV8V427_9GAMM|nr:autotransporter assembly complex family protein [Simiduia curdlanivorans]MDN3637408.1 autotransporter assembly complex family protein [Simiduia curdlanivorans]
MRRSITRKLLRTFSCLCFAGATLVHGEVLLTGVDGELADNIKAHLTITAEDCKAPRWRLQQRRKSADEQVGQALNAYGYYSYQLKLSFSEVENCWQLNVEVAPGERVRLRNVRVQAIDRPLDLDATIVDLLQSPPLMAGQPLKHSDYDNYKTALLDSVRAQGYWRAKFSDAELAIYPDQFSADVKLTLEFGARYYFGAYEFSASPLDQDLLLRLAGAAEGEPYSAEALQDIYSRLQGSDYFQQVLLNPRVDSTGQSVVVPIAVDVGMKSQTSFGAGIGYSTDQKMRVRADYQNRYFNAKGHKWRVDALYSQTLQELGGTYTIPRQEAAREWYEISGGWVRENTVSYESQATTTRIRAVEALPQDWILNTGVNVRYESYVIGSEEPDEQWLVVPGVGVSWVNANNEVRQTLGVRVEAEVTASSQYWLSGTDFAQLRVKTKFILPLSEKGRLLLRGEVAGTLKDDFSELPPSVRFFTGGDNSIRGYEYNSLGTTNDEGEVIGGSHLAVASLEYDYLFLPSWSASVFYDAGDAFDTVFALKRGVGIGLRWYSPVGPLRIDIASPLDSEDNYRFHISVGADL